MHRSLTAAVFYCILAVASRGQAQVGDPTLRTDHPQYAGEGAFQSAADCVLFAEAAAAKGKKLTEQERALAIYNWLLTHQWHLLSPQENCVPGKAADSAKSQEDLIVFDAAKARFSYGYGLCGTVHAWNEAYWKAAGFNARRRAFPGHTNSEIFYGDAWHAFDTDMAGLLFRKDGVVAGYADIIADPSLADSVKPPYPHYPFAWPSDFQTMKAGWQEVAKNPDKWFAMYNGGYEAMPGIIHLRKGETFTRWFDPDHYGGPTKRRFWHNLKNGPIRDWTFANNGEPRHDGKEHNARGNASYCNGEFVLEWKKPNNYAVPYRINWDSNPNAMPMLYFNHLSPYVICGDPVDDANPMTGRATDGLIVDGEIWGDVYLAMTADHGQTWHKVEKPILPLDLTEYVRGRFGWEVVLGLQIPQGEIKKLKFTTTTQVSQAIYPRLKPSGSQVTYRARDRVAAAAIPNFGALETEVKQFEKVNLRSDNVAYRGRIADSRLAYQTTNNKAGSIVFQVPCNGGNTLAEVRAAIRYQVRVPPPAEHDYRLEISWDEGKNWQTFAKADIPADNEHSNGWLAGTIVPPHPMKRDPFSENWSALVRVNLYAGGHQTGLLDAQLYGIANCERSGPLQITYGWKENGELKTAELTLPAGTAEKTWKVPTGEKIRDEFVRMTAN